MKQTIQDAINDQIQAEFQSAYLYLAMAARFERKGFKGFAHWLRIQWEEETQHAMKFYTFLLQRDGQVELYALDKPEATFEAPLEAFETILEQEQHITGRIHRLYDLAVNERDYALQTLLHWFIDEQVEEEENVREIIDTLRLIGQSGAELFVVDRELGQRAGTPQV